MHLRSPRHLRIAAHAELISLIVMLANVFTVHLKPVSSLMGPTHGCAYLFVVIASWRLKEASAAAKALALVPGVGGLLVLRQLGPGDSAHAQAEGVIPS
ncbi:DUF3817 domain-containing protein [Streptomyces albus subsp. chlorinus]|uniref:DUF3817 domain-containing protein n=1 Tax=Streptomyces albus TaxID=1888 RepID=UPI00156FFD0B|nr:DUF3817 domain-containing protein [Streptomyces albus]NSC19753.1 DUF3817 domain-containing protein [Streptomyces albus subsp. chlorinus]